MKSKHYLHGGNLDQAAREYGVDRSEIIDFSGNINPLGISEQAKQSILENTHCISTYPDRKYVELRGVIGKYCGAKLEDIIVGNGVSELISLVINTLKPKKTMTLAPTYSEYEREVGMVGGKLDYYVLPLARRFKVEVKDLLEELGKGYELFILCNPNNPTSTAFNAEELDEIIYFCKEREIVVMVDETYIEFCDEPNKYGAIPLVDKHENLIVLRGISKFFSAPGLRFGYAITSNEKLRGCLLETQNPWSVNSVAEVAVKAMLQDEEYIQATHALFVQERKRVLDKLSTFKNLDVYKPEANFVLLKIKNDLIKGHQVMDELLQKKILIRDASSFPSLDESFIRFCFLDSNSNDLLLHFLYTIIG